MIEQNEISNDNTMGKDIQKSVRFSQVEIIELAYIIGDNPSVASGPPLTVDWRALRRTELGLETYELIRPKRRSKLVMSEFTRRKILSRMGYSNRAIEDASAKTERVQRMKMILSQIDEVCDVVKKAEDSIKLIDNAENRFACTGIPDRKLLTKQLAVPTRVRSPKGSLSRKDLLPCPNSLHRRSTPAISCSNAPIPIRTVSPTGPMMRKKAKTTMPKSASHNSIPSQSSDKSRKGLTPPVRSSSFDIQLGAKGLKSLSAYNNMRHLSRSKQ